MVKISLEARLGDGLGAKMTHEGHQELQKLKNIGFVGLPGSPTWSKNLEKNYLIFFTFFWHDRETTFSRSWDDFERKNLSQIGGLRLTFSTS